MDGVAERTERHSWQKGPAGLAKSDGLVFMGQFVEANKPESRELGRLASFKVLPQLHKSLLNGVKRKASRRSLTDFMFHKLTSATIDVFRNAQ
jgi:hypothetical protein